MSYNVIIPLTRICYPSACEIGMAEVDSKLPFTEKHKKAF